MRLNIVKGMEYQEALDFLYKNVPMFQQVGKAGYKEGLETTCFLDNHFKHPHHFYKTIHIGGTNGKGSCSHTLAAILQAEGYKTGLYTSPHMIDFRERMRVNGIPAPKKYVTDFLNQHRELIEKTSPSFFELTTIMAFNYFYEEKVDVAIIEVGLGGRLDCTNIIRPELSIITNISFDHTQFLGETLDKIASEKAGIIKEKVPVVIGETTKETKEIFTNKANSVNAPIIFAEEENLISAVEPDTNEGWIYQTTDYPNLHGELGGEYQIKNTNTLLTALRILKSKEFHISEKAVRKGFTNVIELTGISGRWQKISNHPLIVCDTGHNESGVKSVVEQIKKQKYNNLHIIWGMVNDKDITSILKLLPTEATYYFTKASIERALPANELYKIAQKFGLKGKPYPNVEIAFQTAKENAKEHDFIFLGGSTFMVADLMELIS